jgi:hypothetical protein
VQLDEGLYSCVELERLVCWNAFGLESSALPEAFGVHPAGATVPMIVVIGNDSLAVQGKACEVRFSKGTLLLLSRRRLIATARMQQRALSTLFDLWHSLRRSYFTSFSGYEPPSFVKRLHQAFEQCVQTADMVIHSFNQANCAPDRLPFPPLEMAPPESAVEWCGIPIGPPPLQLRSVHRWAAFWARRTDAKHAARWGRLLRAFRANSVVSLVRSFRNNIWKVVNQCSQSMQALGCDLRCPLTGQLPRRPVVAGGRVYDEEALTTVNAWKALRAVPTFKESKIAKEIAYLQRLIALTKV